MSLRLFVSSVFGGGKSSTSQPAGVPKILPPNVLVDEEQIPGYELKNFYPANPGDVLNGRFELLAKLGWGTSSTVWLARDTSWKIWPMPTKYFAIKICTSNVLKADSSHELDITNHLDSVKSEHRGRVILGTAIESFCVDSPTGSSHLALVFEPMREPLWLLRRRLTGEEKATEPFIDLFKEYFRILLEGLDFLHSEGHVIHTDLKLDNIMATLEDQTVIERFVKGQTQHPMARKVVGDGTIYRCHNNFGEVDGNEALGKIFPKITDFGLAQRGDKPGRNIHPIQPNDYHAPEVLLGTGWSYSADIWNFGVMMWHFLAGQGLFQRGDPKEYSPVGHLAEMIALLGPVPQELVEREREMRVWRWSPVVRNPRGELCNNAMGYFEGPFFTDDGEFVRRDLIPFDRNLPSEVPDCIPDDEVEDFLRFMRRMLCWLPEERATARELKDDPWFD